MNEDLLTAKEVATILRTSAAYVLAHSNGNRQPTIPSIKLSTRMVRFRREDVDAFIRKYARSENDD